jgi:Kef-type K+ transport system membrane component KefB
VGEVMAGVVLGVSALSKISGFQTNIFPAKSLLSLELVAEFGLVFQIFMVSANDGLRNPSQN